MAYLLAFTAIARAPIAAGAFYDKMDRWYVPNRNNIDMEVTPVDANYTKCKIKDDQRQ